ncbi:hypothetical protein HNQ77_004329 [Silvibacterium bohemicum]|uniref:Uncharacterized protein n=1 Tax=Silvibacterium bohemicum TaxID=1577686 RepID=A0A841K185_9BACT|nr:hypothetical protein [Silvibacterium bohemicum]MBB6146357.1 hypothetical protein [Silvibacterium bohemicum]
MKMTFQSACALLWHKSLWLTVIVLCSSVPAWAHVGPPFPIMQNRTVGPYKVDVWSNPDVGTGSFFITIDPPPGKSVPSDIKVEIAVQPVSKRLAEARYGAWREKLRDRVEYKTEVPFDKEEQWHVRLILTSTLGSGETSTDVPVTPTLLGRWGLLLFALPFVGVGFLWIKAMSVKREQRRKKRLRKMQAAGRES